MALFCSDLTLGFEYFSGCSGYNLSEAKLHIQKLKLFWRWNVSEQI